MNNLAALIILVFSPWRPLLESEVKDYLGRIGISAALLMVVELTYRSARLERYRQILVGLLILSVAVSLDLIFGTYLIKALGVTDIAPVGWAVQKLNEGFIVISAIILLNKTAGDSPGSIYLQKGNLKLGLIIGAATFLLAAAGSFLMAGLFKARDLSIARITPWIPWLLIYVLVNGTMEELMFRGLFLRKLQPFFGKIISNFLVAFVCTGLHGTVTYSADNLLFLAVTFPLALLWGYLMQKTDSMWGSIWFDGGMDIPIMLGIFSNLA
ncbi:CAAX protease self-immunity [Longilinea arvoryzae]|uniref:CAAX protease self-immunity n=1 Tax=Longilinea arvoryzae TaxID=360412 RepID=A0A0S7B6U1_9CHLR|nr:CPBP family intramembrane glutamic endopeptidase [Longilinea arvoryzae]GAP12759.1 CAAX protease self-immunity [Longilinea arvoryzae]